MLCVPFVNEQASLRVLLRVYCGDHYVGGMQGFTIPKH